MVVVDFGIVADKIDLDTGVDCCNTGPVVVVGILFHFLVTVVVVFFCSVCHEQLDNFVVGDAVLKVGRSNLG